MDLETDRPQHPKLDFGELERRAKSLRKWGLGLGGISVAVLGPLGANTGKGGRPLIEFSPTVALLSYIAGFVALGCGLIALVCAYRARELGALLPRPNAGRRSKS